MALKFWHLALAKMDFKMMIKGNAVNWPWNHSSFALDKMFRILEEKLIVLESSKMLLT